MDTRYIGSALDCRRGEDTLLLDLLHGAITGPLVTINRKKVTRHAR